MLCCLLLFFPRSDYNIACGPSTLNEQLLAGGLLWKGNGLLLPPQLERIVTAIVKKKEQYNAIEHQTSLPKHAKFTATATKKKS